jgi:hypothetical protein
MSKPSKAEIERVMNENEAERLAAVAGHPNPAVSIWRMLPGCHYGATIERNGKRERVIGYTVRTAGKEKFMPIDVARRLVKDGKCESPLGPEWITVNEGWRP